MSLFPLTEYKSPGQLIDDLLHRRGWTKRVLAIVLGSDETTLSKIIASKRSLDAEMALHLSEVFGVPAEAFLQLQKNYDLAQARLLSRPDPARATRAKLFGDLPVSEMIKRGWIKADDIRDVPKVETELAKFFGVNSASEIEIMPHAAKKTDVVGEITPAQLAWLYRVRQIAAEMMTARFSHAGAVAAAQMLKALVASHTEVRKVPRILAEAGIRFLIVEALPGSKIDGVCFWLDEASPVIALSLRFDRIDNFWFVLRHELEHVIKEHGKDAAILDSELEGERAGTGENIPEQERVANLAAAEFCVPQSDLNSFIDRKGPLFRETDMVNFAKRIRIHPGLVAGQLQHRTGRLELFRNHLTKIRDTIAPSAMVDGWGDVAPIGI